VIPKGTSPNTTDFISDLLQLLKCFGSITEYKSAILPKLRREAPAEVPLSLGAALGLARGVLPAWWGWAPGAPATAHCSALPPLVPPQHRLLAFPANFLKRGMKRAFYEY